MTDNIEITVRQNVNGQDNIETYSMTYEQFGMILPILKECERKEMPDIGFPFLTGLLGATQQKKNTIFYDVSKMPSGMSEDHILGVYARYGIVFFDGTKEKGKNCGNE